MDLTGALGAWSELLGEDRVHDDDATLDRYARTTLASAPRPLAVVRPGSTDEVAAAVRVAGEHEVPVYPISRGRNWGFGDACPAGEGQAVLDLSGMDRILEVDEELAYAVVEPGVSQEQLHEHLAQRGIDLWLPTTGSTPDASLLANAIERGWGHTPYGDHWGNVCGMQVVLADGTVVDTGAGRYPQARTGSLFKTAPGPYVDGLFTQSNLGVVTRVGLWLMPKPERFVPYILAIMDPSNLPLIVDRLRPLRLGGVIQNALHFSNDLRTFSYRQGYPWKETGGRTPLPADVAAQMRESWKYSPWAASGAFYGTRAQVKAHQRALKQAVDGLCQVIFMDPKMLDLAERIARPLARLGHRGAQIWATRIPLARPGIALLRGAPTEAGLSSCRWRVRELRDPESLDPHDNGCGFYWATPVCPMRGNEVKTLLHIVETTIREHRLDPLLTMTLLNGRAVLVTAQITFDKAVPEEAAAAEACHAELLERVVGAGYPPYRVATSAMAELGPEGSPYWDLVDRLKGALDPARILAPGRYEESGAARATETAASR